MSLSSLKSSILSLAYKAKWVLLALLSVAAVLVLYMLGRRKDDTKFSLPDVPEALKEKVRQAEEDALRAKIEAKVKAEEQKKQLEKVMEDPDGATRRKKLAEFLSSL